MILKLGLFLLFLHFFLCDDHIPRENDERPPNLPPLNSEPLIKDSDLPSLDVLNDLPSKSIDPPPAVLSTLQEELPLTYGGSAFRDSSYIALTILVAKRSFDCYFYKARKSFEIDFQVLKGGDYDIALSIFDVHKKQAAFHNPAGDGNLKVHVPQELIDTDYSICLDNQQTSWHTKKVFLMIDIEGPNGLTHPDLQVGEYGQLHQHLNKLDLMNTALSNVHQTLMKIEQHQERRRLVEAVDRSIMESNYEYVTLWAMVQIGLMVLVAVIQLLMIRSLFDSRGGICSKIWIKLNTLSGDRL